MAGKNKTNIYDAVLEAMRAEGTTYAGKSNIVLCSLLIILDLALGVKSVVELICQTILALNDKQQVENLPSASLTGLIIATIVMFFICLWVVSKPGRTSRSQ